MRRFIILTDEDLEKLIEGEAVLIDRYPSTNTGICTNLIDEKTYVISEKGYRNRLLKGE